MLARFFLLLDSLFLLSVLLLPRHRPPLPQNGRELFIDLSKLLYQQKTLTRFVSFRFGREGGREGKRMLFGGRGRIDHVWPAMRGASALSFHFAHSPWNAISALSDGCFSALQNLPVSSTIGSQVSALGRERASKQASEQTHECSRGQCRVSSERPS